jgi:hypothetical protein
MQKSKPDNRVFISPDAKFSLTLPQYWEEHDDGEESTFAFFNGNSWTGNFRITPLYWTHHTDNKTNKCIEFIEEEMGANPHAERMIFGDFDCAHYKKNVVQDDALLVIYYWAIGRENNLFLCSFTIDKTMENTEQNFSEIKTVENILASIRVH